MGAMETLDLFPEFAINHTFYPWKFFTDGQLDTEARCLFKVHFDYDLREDQVNSLIFRSQNLTTYWDVKYHVGPCFSQQYLNRIEMNYTFKLDPQQEWDTVIDDSYPIDYVDHFYVSIKPLSVEQTETNLLNLLSTEASLELEMSYSENYEYDAPEVTIEESSTSQAVVFFWMLTAIAIAYLVLAFLWGRRKRIYSFLAGMVMPSAEFRYREYQIDRRFKQISADADPVSQINLRRADYDALDEIDNKQQADK